MAFLEGGAGFEGIRHRGLADKDAFAGERHGGFVVEHCGDTRHGLGLRRRCREGAVGGQ